MGEFYGREETNLIVKVEHYSNVLLLSIFASNTISISQIFKKNRAIQSDIYNVFSITEQIFVILSTAKI